MDWGYSKLDESRDEIRLITLLPFSNDSNLVQCRLETVSLTNFSPQYQAFVSGSQLSRLSGRKAVRNWCLSRAGDEKPISASVNKLHNRCPSKSSYRFDWGDYAAFSYVWGNQNETATIKVNGQEREVTTNLEVALRTFSTNSEFSEGFKLWVDAICINQDDLVERGSQVGRMREIYSTAWTVVAWLGEEHYQSDKAVQLIRDLAEFYERKEGKYLEERLREDPGLLGNGCWLALQEFMDRSYWYRLWILQELIMGASAVVIRCGSSAIDWETFCAGITLVEENLWLVKDELLRRDIDRLGVAKDPVWSTASLHLIYQDLSSLSNFEETEGERHYLSFGRILDIANWAQCLDPRDKVYGLVGLMKPEIAQKIIPDYALHPMTVYANATRLFIETSGSLDPIREGNLWGLFLGSGLGMDWSRSNGFVLDSVSGLSARGQGYFAWVKASVHQREPWKSVYGDRSSTSEALYRTIVADRVSGGKKADERHSVIFHLPSTFVKAGPQFSRRKWDWLSAQQGYYFRWQKWRAANRDFLLGEHKLSSFFDDKIPEGASEFDVTEVYSCFDRTCQKRRLMTTKLGYLGWAPDNIYGDDEAQTRIGDRIAIIFGCSTPMIIRPKGRYFQVIGEAYVQGMMDGEAIEWLENSKVYRAQSFTFC